VVLEQTNDFVNNHLLSMLGAPDFVGDLRGALQDFTSSREATIINPLPSTFGFVLNPIQHGFDQLKEWGKKLVKD
jgi:hypothetical protein